MEGSGDEWSFHTVPDAARVAEVLADRTGWAFTVVPVDRGEVAIVATEGGGIRWAPVGGEVVRVDVHERMTPYMSWQADAALVALGGECDRRLERPPIELVPWKAVSRWNQVRHGGRAWVVQVVLIVLLALPVVIMGALVVAGRGRPREE